MGSIFFFYSTRVLAVVHHPLKPVSDWNLYWVSKVSILFYFLFMIFLGFLFLYYLAPCIDDPQGWSHDNSHLLIYTIFVIALEMLSACWSSEWCSFKNCYFFTLYAERLVLFVFNFDTHQILNYCLKLTITYGLWSRCSWTNPIFSMSFELGTLLVKLRSFPESFHLVYLVVFLQ